MFFAAKPAQCGLHSTAIVRRPQLMRTAPDLTASSRPGERLQTSLSRLLT